ncbi:hypothetical protein [Rhodobacter sp. NSM]|uniref:hypothetical protein n=1 Tax=Rhodobacter sp. NSM TaxID=3457501 RepID=UPI003FD157A0
MRNIRVFAAFKAKLLLSQHLTVHLRHNAAAGGGGSFRPSFWCCIDRQVMPPDSRPVEPPKNEPEKT